MLGYSKVDPMESYYLTMRLRHFAEVYGSFSTLVDSFNADIDISFPAGHTAHRNAAQESRLRALPV